VRFHSTPSVALTFDKSKWGGTIGIRLNWSKLIENAWTECQAWATNILDSFVFTEWTGVKKYLEVWIAFQNDKTIGKQTWGVPEAAHNFYRSARELSETRSELISLLLIIQSRMYWVWQGMCF
jgi:hypothetical protein